MNAVLLDLWHELRERRLWPVALALVLALVAVPVLLLKPASEPAPAAPQSTATRPPAGLLPGGKVELATDGAGRGSALRVFDPKDPFHPPRWVIEHSAAASSASSSSSAATGTGGGAPATGGASGGAGAGGSTGSTGSTGSAGPAPAPTTRLTPRKRTRTGYTYVVDVTVRRGGRTRRIRGLRRFGMLPSERTPLLLFLGVDSSAQNAVFLVDSTVTTEGEGSCNPSDSCTLLSLGGGSEQRFTPDGGESFTLSIDEIRKVKVSSKASASARRRRPSRERERRGSAGKPAAARKPVRRFVPPVLLDLVTVASPVEGGSSADAGGR